MEEVWEGVLKRGSKRHEGKIGEERRRRRGQGARRDGKGEGRRRGGWMGHRFHCLPQEICAGFKYKPEPLL